ncbi:MAG: DUF3263 domain-containing protein [Streptomycetaceae bacterium]|nr:DUF3263 domain-containing protein [Streptomycetaceae bacterium]
MSATAPPSDGEQSDPPRLSAQDIAILAFERRHFASGVPAAPGPKERAIREELGLRPTRYYQRLNQLIDTREALERHPVMVNRLRSIRESRRRARSSGARHDNARSRAEETL